jgi:hypothetical protein
MNSPVHDLAELLRLFSDTGPDDQGWSDFGDERASRILATFSDADWNELVELSESLSPGELDVVSTVIASSSHQHVVPLLVRAVLSVNGPSWIEAAESLALRHSSNPSLLKPFAAKLQANQSVKFIEQQLRDWLNFPQRSASFDEYLAEHRHLVSPSVMALVAYARRTPNTSLERTREG